MKLLVDLDGCVVQYDFPKLIKKYFGVELPQKSIFAYDIADVLGVSHKSVDDMFREQVYGKADFIDGSLEILKKWPKKHEIVIYSNRVNYMGEVGLAKWLVENKIPFNGIDVIGSEEYDFHIDDSPAKLMGTKSLFKLLYNQPWNERCLDIIECLQRVYSWEEIDDKVSRQSTNVKLSLQAPLDH